jgi:hypothetical protein
MLEALRTLKSLRWHGKNHLRRFYYPLKYRKPFPILGRHVCLGAAILKLLKPKQHVINIERGRVDYLCSCWNDSRFIARSSAVMAHMKIVETLPYPYIDHEWIVHNWLRPEMPVALFMDSMSELGDQMFVHKKKGWRFLRASRDVVHSNDFRRNFEYRGLLPINDLEMYFKKFFRNIMAKYSDIPVFYLHFPPKLETRKKFTDRHDAIQKTINNISGEFQNLFSISADNSIVAYPKDAPSNKTDFPSYHYNRETYEHFVDLILETGAWKFSKTNVPQKAMFGL